MDELVDLITIDSYDFLKKIYKYLVKLESHRVDKRKFLDDEYIMKITDGMHKSYDNADEPIKICVIDDEIKSRYKKYHFTGEFDSNQTSFELLSNHLRIATVSYDNNVGKILLFLVRYIIDEHELGWIDQYALDVLGDKYPNGIEYNGEHLNEGTYPIEMIIDFMARKEDYYYHMYDPLKDGMYVTGKLIGYNNDGIYTKTTIRRLITEVDTWSFYRVFSALGIIGNEEEWDLLKD